MSATRPRLAIPVEVRDAMVAHCRREAPLEACGLLGGAAPLASSIHILTNVSASPVRYDADPAEVIAAHVALREKGHQILAIYHSHPSSPAVPSRVDLRENHWEDMPRIIVSLQAEPPDVRVWRLDPDSFEELDWELLPAGAAAFELNPRPRRDKLPDESPEGESGEGLRRSAP